MDVSEPIAHAREFMHGEIMRAVLSAWREQTKPWGKLSQAHQTDIVAMLSDCVRLALTRAVHIIASDARSCFPVHLVQVVFKEKNLVEAKLLMIADAYSHELANYAGKRVLVVIEDAARYTGGGNGVQAEPDQPDIFERRI